VAAYIFIPERVQAPSIPLSFLSKLFPVPYGLRNSWGLNIFLQGCW